MLNDTLTTFYERDLRTLIEEINLFKTEKSLWQSKGLVNNPAGNLALHIIGGLNFLIGATLAKTGYLRNRPAEFNSKEIDRAIIVNELESLIPAITAVIKEINLEDEYPIPFDDDRRTVGYVLIQLLSHLNYHLGQVNYLRRLLEC